MDRREIYQEAHEPAVRQFDAGAKSTGDNSYQGFRQEVERALGLGGPSQDREYLLKLNRELHKKELIQDNFEIVGIDEDHHLLIEESRKDNQEDIQHYDDSLQPVSEAAENQNVPQEQAAADASEAKDSPVKLTRDQEGRIVGIEYRGEDDGTEMRLDRTVERDAAGNVTGIYDKHIRMNGAVGTRVATSFVTVLPGKVIVDENNIDNVSGTKFDSVTIDDATGDITYRREDGTGLTRKANGQATEF